MIVPDIIESFLDSISWEVDILSLSNAGANTALVCKNVLYARQGLTLSINNESYEVLEVDYSDNTIIVAGVFSSAKVGLLEAPIFLHGTPMMTNSHFTRAKQIHERMTPLIYLLEVFNRESAGLYALTESMNLRMFFLDDARGDWLTDDHYSEVILPMSNLADYVERKMYDYIKMFVPESFTIEKTDHVNFGEYKTLKGHLQSIFDARLSGVERRFKGFEILKTCR